MSEHQEQQADINAPGKQTHSGMPVKDLCLHIVMRYWTSASHVRRPIIPCIKARGSRSLPYQHCRAADCCHPRALACLHVCPPSTTMPSSRLSSLLMSSAPPFRDALLVALHASLHRFELTYSSILDAPLP